ncbi:unnamed protein product, partial [Brassica oleracea]
VVTSSPTLQGGLVRTKLPFRSVEICADGFTVTFPIPPIGENFLLSVFGEAMEPLFLSLYEASGGFLSVLPLCFTDQFLLLDVVLFCLFMADNSLVVEQRRFQGERSYDAAKIEKQI